MRQADLQGHWRRNWLRAPGFEDTTTRVHWVQAGHWCAAIRVPLVRPNLGVGSLSARIAGVRLTITHWQGTDGVADLSTQPFCEGQKVLARTPYTATLTLPAFHGDDITQTLRLSPLSND